MQFRTVLLCGVLAACTRGGYLAIRDPGKDVVTRGYALAGATYYSLPTTPPSCIEGARAGWMLAPNQLEQRGGFDLYAHDPFATSRTFLELSDDDILRGRWDRHDDFASPIRDVAVLGYPSSAGAGVEATARLGNALVDGGAVQAMPNSCRRLDTGATEVGSQVVGAVGYHSGLCSARSPYVTSDPAAPGLLQQIADSFWDKFRTHDYFDNPVQKYTKAVGVLIPSLPEIDYRVSATGVAPLGGFVLTFHYSVDVLSVGRDIWGTYQYTFDLDPTGVLVAVPVEQRLRSSPQDPSSGGLSVISGVRDGLQHELPAKLRAAALATQAFFPAPGLPCSVVSDCQGLVPAVSGRITHDSVLAAWGIDAAPSSVSALKCAIGDDAACDAAQAAHRSSEVWACMPPPATPANPSPAPSCALQLRAKRLVPHQDELELAWFDGADWLSTAFALSVAADPQQRAQLCSAPPAPPGPGLLPKRTLATVSRP